MKFKYNLIIKAEKKKTPFRVREKKVSQQLCVFATPSDNSELVTINVVFGARFKMVMCTNAPKPQHAFVIIDSMRYFSLSLFSKSLSFAPLTSLSALDHNN